MSLLSSILKLVTQFTLQIVNGFIYEPVTKLKTGSVFTDMQVAIDYVNQEGKYFLGRAYGSASIAASPSFEQAPEYRPADTTPPKAFPTYQPSGYQVPLGMNDVGQYHFSAEAMRTLKAFEGLHQRAYFLDGEPHIGYGRKIKSYDASLYVSRDEADQMVQADVSAAESLVKGAVSGKLSQGQFDALVDFAYSVPAQLFKASKVVQEVSSGNIPGAATALAQYVYVKQNGVVVKSPHLVARRTAEVKWLTAPVDPTPISEDLYGYTDT
jgi:lysozyme